MKDEILLFLQQKQMEQFNRLYSLRKALYWALKFTCALILYSLANFVITGIFKMFNINPVSIFYNCLSAVNANYSSVVLATSVCTHCLRVSICFALLVSVVWLIISIFVSKALDLEIKSFQSVSFKRCIQYEVVSNATVSYKHHVAFLA